MLPEFVDDITKLNRAVIGKLFADGPMMVMIFLTAYLTIESYLVSK